MRIRYWRREAVQDCVYEVYEDFCEYETQTWVQVDTAVSSGRDLEPEGPGKPDWGSARRRPLRILHH